MAKRSKAAKKGAMKKRRGKGDNIDQFNIAELQAALDKKRGELLEERGELMRRVEQIDRLLGEKVSVKAAKATGKRGKSAAGKGRKAATAGKPRRTRGGVTLGNKLEEILRNAGEPMKLQDLLTAIQNSDYPSKSPHLRSMVNQTLGKDPRFQKVNRGVYKLA